MVICVVAYQPFVLNVVNTGLVPRIARQMADAPCIAACVTRSGYLRMHLAGNQRHAVVMVSYSIAVAPACAEALRLVKAVEVNFRLR